MPVNAEKESKEMSTEDPASRITGRRPSAPVTYSMV